MTNLFNVLSLLTKQKLQIALYTGFQDACGGYGWHVKVHIEVRKCVEFCLKCRDKYGVDYKDDFEGFHHQHAHRQEYPVIYNKTFITLGDNEDAICKDLLSLISTP